MHWAWLNTGRSSDFVSTIIDLLLGGSGFTVTPHLGNKYHLLLNIKARAYNLLSSPQNVSSTVLLWRLRPCFGVVPSSAAFQWNAKVKYVVLSIEGFLCVEAGHGKSLFQLNIKQIIIKLEPQFQCRRNRETVPESGETYEATCLPQNHVLLLFFNYVCTYLARRVLVRHLRSSLQPWELSSYGARIFVARHRRLPGGTGFSTCGAQAQ